MISLIISALCVAVIQGDDTYYVNSSTTSNCPQPCHPLSHYVSDTATYFNSNATFIFMEGEHLLDSKGSVVVISNVDNLTFKREKSHSNAGIIIKCSNNTRGLKFMNGGIITIYGITITGCGYSLISPLSFENIASLHIHHITICKSNLIYGGGLYITLSHTTRNNITITSSIFKSNRVDSFGGGVLIVTSNDIYSDIIITNCTFTDNIINHGGGLWIHTSVTMHKRIKITNSAFNDNIIIGDTGGGLHITAITTINNSITITCSTFNNNTVGNNGGGLSISSHKNFTHNSIAISSSEFTNNTVTYNGGGVRIYSENDSYNTITIDNSTFAGNAVGNVGGGLAKYSSNDNNNNIIITNSIFNDNNGTGIVLRFIHYHEVILSQVIVSNNKKSGILAVSQCTIVFTKGNSVIANNSSPLNGGGIYLGKRTYLTTSNGGHVSFINNTAQRYGGAIYSLDEDYTSLSFSPELGIYFGDHCTVYDLLAKFTNNSAVIAGDQLYGGAFVFCHNIINTTIVSNLQPIIECTNVPGNVTNVTSVHPLSPVSSYPLAVCPCVNGTVDCNITSLDSEAYPGQIFHVSLVTVGLCGGVSPGTVVVKHDNNISLMSSTTTDYTSTSCTMLNYTVRITKYISNTILIFNIADSDFYNIRSVKVHLSILPCPLGLALDSISGECICNNQIISQISQVFCNISWMPYPIQRSSNNWISSQYNEYNCTIAHIGCPFDYCNTLFVKFSLSESDLQCNYNRSGILCGQCQPGLSLMIGSNRCTNCTDTTALISVSIVIMAATAGIVLVIFLILLNLTVSIGSINGLLFYANVVKLNESVFFSQGNIPVISQFISWCNLDLGIEYCFIDGLDGYVKTWLQFVFPLYVWVLVIVIIVGCRYSSRLCRLCGRNAVPVLATLILMSYTKLSRTVTNALMMNTLQCGEYKWSVWNVDGNINYLSGKHIALFTVSLLFLVIGLVYTGLVFSSQWLQRYSGKCCKSTRDPVVRLKPLIDAYTGPFKDKYRFWTGLCLIVRLILTVVFSFTTTLQSKLNNYIIILTVGGMTLFRVYKDKRLNVLESLSFVNLICLSVVVILFTDESYHNIVSINVIVSGSVSVEIFLFAIIIFAHCYLALLKAFPNFKLFCKTRFSQVEMPLIVTDHDEEESLPVAQREELIFSSYIKHS